MLWSRSTMNDLPRHPDKYHHRPLVAHLTPLFLVPIRPRSLLTLYATLTILRAQLHFDFHSQFSILAATYLHLKQTHRLQFRSLLLAEPSNLGRYLSCSCDSHSYDKDSHQIGELTRSRFPVLQLLGTWRNIDPSEFGIPSLTFYPYYLRHASVRWTLQKAPTLYQLRRLTQTLRL
jgi:hypothetical protein